MKLLHLTLDRPAENLALDEALLEHAEQSGTPSEVLRLWESTTPVVVLGRSSRINDEVHLQHCERLEIPVLRRTSGGAAIVAGPGCLMYAVLLSCDLRPALQSIDEAHCFVLTTVARKLQEQLPGVRIAGTSDLTFGNQKFSGNSLRCKRSHLLYHGTLLYDFSLPLIDQCLKSPPRQPDYRCGRPHGEFVVNLPLTRERLEQALIDAWQAQEPLAPWPRQITDELVRTRYTQAAWNFSR